MQNTNLTFVPEITWPKDFPELKLIDDALRCGICYDYIKTCMVTPCAHSYCSICIRRSLLYKTACPTCFEETFETNLRNNRVLDRVTELFSSIKDKLVKHLKVAAIHFNCNEQLLSPITSQTLPSSKLTDATPKRNVQKTHKTSSTKAKLQFTPKAETSFSKNSGKSDISKRLEDFLGSPATRDMSKNEMNCLEPSTENDNLRVHTVPPMFLQPKIDVQPKPLDVPMVPCPVCNVNIPERNINVHLDNCLTNVDKPPIKSPVKVKQKRAPLAKMVWSLMAEKDLRKKLKDYGLNTQGDKKVLISRIQRYILLFNSECDSDNPRPVSDIIRQLEREEKQTPAQSYQRLFANNNKCDPKVVEEENKKYIEENKNSFKKLIEAMKEREGRNIKPSLHSFHHRIVSEDEDEDINNKEDEEIRWSRNKSDVPSTSKPQSIDLCDSNESDENISATSSPVLGTSKCANKELFNGHVPGFSISDLTPSSITKSDKYIVRMNKRQSSNLDELCSMLDSPDEEVCNDNLYVPPSQKSRTLSRSPSPSCIVTAQYSDSEDSFSLLSHQTAGGENVFDNSQEAVTESIPNMNSQLEDPDFVLDTEQTENNSDEMFMPQRKAKRKFKHSLLADSKQVISPRRTRRRVNK